MFLNTFPVHILVISLKRAAERRENSKKQLQDLDAQWEFLDAVDGLQLQNSPAGYNEKKVSKLLGFSLTPSEIACFLSHREAWLKCIKKNEMILVLEDDFTLRPNAKQAIDFLLKNSALWDLARLQALSESSHVVIKESNQFKIVQNEGDPLGAAAYLVKPSSAEKLIAHSTEIFEPLDHFLEHFQKHRLRMLAIKPYPVSADHSESTISDRPQRIPVSGIKKIKRSVARVIDRMTSSQPWFPK